MRRFAHRLGPTRPVEGALLLLLMIVSAVGFAACGSSSGSPAASVAPSVPTTSQAPTGSEPPATAPSTPVASRTADASSPTPAPSSTGTALDACALLTGTELSKILGAEGVQGKAMPSSGWIAGQCAWNGSASGFFLSVGSADSIKADGDAAAPNAKAKLAQFREQAGSSTAPRDVSGVGDGAVLAAVGLAATKGDTYLQITNLGMTEDQLIEIAKLVVAKL